MKVTNTWKYKYILCYHVQFFVTPWIVACHVPLSMGILQARILEWFAMPSHQGIFPTQGSNPGLPHCRQIFSCLSHLESPRILKWEAYSFCKGSFRPRNRTGAFCIVDGFFTSWVMRETHKYILMKLNTVIKKSKR